MLSAIKKILFLVSSLCLVASAASLFPPLEELVVGERAEGSPAQIRHGKALLFQAQVEPASLNHLVTLSIAEDGIVLDTSALAEQEFRKVVTTWRNLEQREFDENCYQIDLELSAPEKSSVGLYFEGRTNDNRHFYKASHSRSSGKREVFSASSALPAQFRGFHLRFDFASPGVYRIHDVAFAEIASYRRSADAPRRIPELIFHATFDGDAQPSVARGSAQPLRAERLEFRPGLLGQALQVSKTNRTDLRYATAGNLVPNCGTVALWVKPEWGALSGTSYNKDDYHCFFSMDRPQPRAGSGAIWLWAWGAVPRADCSDLNDSYKTGGRSLVSGQWAHVAMTWDENGSTLFVNGQRASSANDSKSPLAAKDKPQLIFKDQNLPFFFVGSHRQGEFADALLDDLRIYSAPLSEEELTALVNETQLFSLELEDKYVLAGRTEPIKASVISSRCDPMSFNWQLIDQQQQVQRQGQAALAASSERSAQRRLALSIDSQGLAAGLYRLVVKEVSGQQQGVREQQAELLLLKNHNRWSSEGEELQLKALLSIIPNPSMDEEQFLHVGPLHSRELNGRAYLEADAARGSRFVLRASLPDEHAIYLLEWDYPDDKRRSVDIIAQSAICQDNEYELQTGYAAGDEYANSHEFITQKCLYFPRSRDIALIFMTARKDAPAAVAEIRIHQVLGGLAALAVKDAPPVNGFRRSLGLYYEDPAILYDFGVLASDASSLETCVERCAAYMKYSGQDLLSYPLVWYHGRIGRSYNPRNHPENFMSAFLSVFDRDGLGFMATINQHNMPLGQLRITEDNFNDGSLHSSPISIWNTGRPNPGGWHGTAPNFNILHPEVQEHVLGNIEQIIAEGAKHPSFKGITFHLTKHSFLWFGDVQAGYNDYAIDAFTKDTGIAVPVNRDDSLRGKAYAEWLHANAFNEWVDWRCRTLAVLYKGIAQRLRDARADLRLNLCSFRAISDIKHPNYSQPDFNPTMARLAGLDPAYYRDCDNVVITQSIYPADYRWREESNIPAAAYEHLRVFDSLPGCYGLLNGAKMPWLHQHDRYWESAIGSRLVNHWSDSPSFISSSWFRENSWRVSTINPAGRHAMKHFVLPLRYHDLQSITKGGFLVGSYGMEEYLRPFAKAFRALPAQLFADLDTHSETVVARMLELNGQTWFYIANTGDTAASVNLAISGNHVLDLVSGQPLADFRDNRAKINLAPYELRSFSCDGAQAIGIRVPE
jgi:hypothetical protein